jgi:hypothetical protein
MFFNDKTSSSMETWKKYNKTFILPRNKLLEFLGYFSSSKNLGGYFCRIAIGKSKNNTNLYSVVKIIKPTVFEKLNTFRNKKTGRYIILNVQNTNKTFNLNIISNKFPTNDEILKFWISVTSNSIFPIKTIKPYSKYQRATKKKSSLRYVRREKAERSFLQKILTKIFFFKSTPLEF